MVPVAPGLLSTTTVVFSVSCILAPTVRAIMSVEPPGGNGTSSVIANTYGFVVGFDYNYSRDTVFGAAVSSGGSNWWMGNGTGQGRSTTLQAALYGLMREGPAAPEAPETGVSALRPLAAAGPSPSPSPPPRREG